MGIIVRPSGPVPARIMLVGEAPGVEEEHRGEPFVGASGQELTRMLKDAGINRSECFLTNVARERPLANDINNYIAWTKVARTSKHTKVRDLWVTREISEGVALLKKEILTVQPSIIIPFGNTALWALTGEWGITKWRGSMQYENLSGRNTKCISTYHPAAVLRQWSWRGTAITDLQRAARYRGSEVYPKPAWKFIVRPSADVAIGTLQKLLDRLNSGEALRISFDIETRAGHIACAGLSWSLTEAICIPFMCVESAEGYWPADIEGTLVWCLYQILTHEKVSVVGQNIIYDSQYTWRHWRFVPRVTQDTMISQHTLWADLPKSLAYQASIYCDYYSYWKDESKDWDPAVGESQLWLYNCRDCVYTDEAGREEAKLIERFGLQQPHAIQQKMFWPVLEAMQRGVLIDQKRRAELLLEVHEEIQRRENFITEILGHPLNPRSPKQMQTLFYKDLGQQPIINRGKKGKPGTVTTNDEALQRIAAREPLLRPLINAIADIRTLGVFISSFLARPLEDGRMRCAYNIGGSESGKSAPKTYRLSSSEDAFGFGANLQNIPSDKSKSVNKAKERAKQAGATAFIDFYDLPNIRSIFIPDPGMTFFDIDLDRADLQVVVWEADDEMLKAALRMGADIHLMNVYALDGKDPPPLEELVETHPKYHDHRGPRKAAREFAKTFCHGTNYGGKPPTMAAHTGRLVKDVERAQKLWFGAHPGILTWHERVKASLQRNRYVENKFGFRWYVFDRIESIIPEAIAWIPQSTVSNVINQAWIKIYETLPDVQVRLQVHDSLAGQFPTRKYSECTKAIIDAARIVVPYDDPLIIPVGIKTSEKSWGDCK